MSKKKSPKVPKTPKTPKTPPAPAVQPVAEPPSSLHDLSHWTLTIPGQSTIIRAADLVAGYTNPKYFYLLSDAAMAFRATTAGFTTANSNYPRSELREQLLPPSNSANWELAGRHVLDATCRVAQLSAAKKVIIGQVHAYQGNAYPLVKLFHRNGNIELDVKRGPLDNTDDKSKICAMKLGTWFNYQIIIEGTELMVRVDDHVLSQKLNPDWDSNSFYFKAGAYCIDASGDPKDAAEVHFSHLSVSHGPSL
jgi:hypothetical protein